MSPKRHLPVSWLPKDKQAVVSGTLVSLRRSLERAIHRDEVIAVRLLPLLRSLGLSSALNLLSLHRRLGLGRSPPRPCLLRNARFRSDGRGRRRHSTCNRALARIRTDKLLVRRKSINRCLGDAPFFLDQPHSRVIQELVRRLDRSVTDAGNGGNILGCLGLAHQV